jgi:hypothetical protein
MNASDPKNPALDALVRSLDGLIKTHGELLATLREQLEAMRKMDAVAMSDAGRRQEAIHRRLLRLETDRRRAARALATSLRLPADAALTDIAARLATPPAELQDRRVRLRSLSTEAAKLGEQCSRLAGGVLAHLNSSLRLLTGGGTYAAGGNFHMPPRLSRMEAIG